jgi:hypothetical protein
MDESVIKHLAQPRLDGPARLLLKAAALIEEYGHCQTGEGHDGKRMCVMVALQKAAGVVDLHIDVELARDRLERHIPNVRSKFAGNLVRAARWSDSTPTAEVLAKLRAVALSG